MYTTADTTICSLSPEKSVLIERKHEDCGEKSKEQEVAEREEGKAKGAGAEVRGGPDTEPGVTSAELRPPSCSSLCDGGTRAGQRVPQSRTHVQDARHQCMPPAKTATQQIISTKGPQSWNPAFSQLITQSHSKPEGGSVHEHAATKGLQSS